MTPEEELLHAQDDADCTRFLLIRYKRWVKELRDYAEKMKAVAECEQEDPCELTWKDVEQLSNEALNLNYEKIDAMIAKEADDRESYNQRRLATYLGKLLKKAYEEGGLEKMKEVSVELMDMEQIAPKPKITIDSVEPDGAIKYTIELPLWVHKFMIDDQEKKS